MSLDGGAFSRFLPVPKNQHVENAKIAFLPPFVSSWRQLSQPAWIQQISTDEEGQSYIYQRILTQQLQLWSLWIVRPCHVQPNQVLQSYNLVLRVKIMLFLPVLKNQSQTCIHFFSSKCKKIKKRGCIYIKEIKNNIHCIC